MAAPSWPCQNLLTMRKTAIVILFALLSASYVHAQLEKVLHQSFDLDGVNSINLELYGEYEIEKWAGNSILTETSVQIYDATPGIFKHFVEKDKRYGIEANLTDESAIRETADCSAGRISVTMMPQIRRQS